jgi:hypothetical protein
MSVIEWMEEALTSYVVLLLLLAVLLLYFPFLLIFYARMLY